VSNTILTPQGPTLAEPQRSHAAHAVRRDIEDALEAFVHELERWWCEERCERPQLASEHQEIAIVDARNHLLSAIKQLDALTTLGRPLPSAQLDELTPAELRPD
jgi:hypothetical protein